MSGVIKASYARPGEKGKHPSSLVRYMDQDRDQERDPERKPKDGREPKKEKDREKDRERAPEREPQMAAERFGDRAAFVREALARSRNRTAYVHLVLSPQRGNRYDRRDFERLLSPWTADRGGRGCAFYAVVHRDTDNHHMHVAAARDRFGRAELERLKAETRALMRRADRLKGGGFSDGLRAIDGMSDAQKKEEGVRAPRSA